MGFQKGHAKHGGRKKGSLNKDVADVFARCKELNFDPLETLIAFAKGDYQKLNFPSEKRIIGYSNSGAAIEAFHIEPELRQKSAKEICEYLYPKRKAIDHTVETQQIDLNVNYKSAWGNTEEPTDGNADKDPDAV